MGIIVANQLIFLGLSFFNNLIQQYLIFILKIIFLLIKISYRLLVLGRLLKINWSKVIILFTIRANWINISINANTLKLFIKIIHFFWNILKLLINIKSFYKFYFLFFLFLNWLLILIYFNLIIHFFIFF